VGTIKMTRRMMYVDMVPLTSACQRVSSSAGGLERWFALFRHADELSLSACGYPFLMRSSVNHALA
jgi:hypothetical protein